VVANQKGVSCRSRITNPAWQWLIGSKESFTLDTFSAVFVHWSVIRQLGNTSVTHRNAGAVTPFDYASLEKLFSAQGSNVCTDVGLAMK
jgi:hypothetical protein